LRTEKQGRYLPVEKYPYLILRFYDSYTYYSIPKNLLALWSGSPAPYAYERILMTLTFENDNDVIVYALEKIISYTRQHQYIFVAQSVWWQASIIGIPQGLAIHIDNLNSRSGISSRKVEYLEKNTSNQIDTSYHRKRVSTIPRDVQGDCMSDSVPGNIHPDRISQTQTTIHDISGSELDDSEPVRLPQIIRNTEQFIQTSWKERKEFHKQKHINQLSKTRTGCINPLRSTKKAIKKAGKLKPHSQTEGRELSVIG